jgi:hypothetical protein
MATRPKLSRIVANQLPEFIREDYPTFVAFLEAYYEYLEQNDADVYELRDIDKTLDRFITYFKNEVSPNSVAAPLTDQRFLLSNIKDAHLAKGSEASYKLLFRLMYNKNVTVQYPGQQILRASDGKWNQDVSIFAKVNAGDPNDIVGRLVDVITPNRVIRVLVDRRQDVEIEVDRFVQISPDTYEFYIDRRFFGDVSIGDRLRYGGVFDATIVATTARLTVLQRGKNFKPGQLYPIKNGDGAGTIMKVKSVDSAGGIAAAEYVKYGIGYDTDFTATIMAEGGQTITGAGQTALSIANIQSAVTSINITSGGTGYSNNPTVALSGGGFSSAATVGAVTVVGGVITSIKVATPGNGYVTAPNVIITDSTGTGANATSTIGVSSGYGIFETTNGFNEQGFINLADYTQDISTIWEQRKAFATGDQIYWNSILYDVTVGGTSGSTPPSHNTGSATNGSMTLAYSRVHGPAFEGTYSGDTLREFYFDSKDAVIDPDDPAIIRIDLGPLTKYPGYYKNNDGFLDDAIFIQDSRYYQAFSYVLKIDERLESYKSAVKTLIHPAGLALFGEYDIRNEFDISVSLQSMVKILVVNVQDEISLVSTITSKDFGKALDETITVPDSNTKLVSKPLTDSFTPSEVISAKDFDKALADATLGFTEVRTFGLSKPVADSIATPSDVISTKDFDKALAEIITVPDSNTFLLDKALADSITTPTDVVSAKDFDKALSDSITTPSDTISSKVLNKPLEESVATLDVATQLFGKEATDSISLSDVDTITKTFTKYTSDTLSPTDSGNLFFNPYVADPYPTNYWAADYTTGESSF